MLIQDTKKRALVYQVVAVILVAWVVWTLFQNTQANLQTRNITTGFDFLSAEASFDISESFLISYSASDTYLRAFAVGILNTLKVSIVGIFFTIISGTILGIARLSKNWLVQKVSASFIELFRNTPLLLQLFFWYMLFSEIFPHPRQAHSFFDVFFVSNRGFYFPVLHSHPIHFAMAIALGFGMVGSWLFQRFARKRQDETGQVLPTGWINFGLLLGPSVLVWLISGAPLSWNIPVLKGFNFKGGNFISPEFGALLLGLILYTAAFVAETVRAGILSVSKGQTEAASSLGLKPGLTMNLIILPQALRVIIPPLTNQMLNLLKNSSLALAIGYPDVVAVMNTTLNQTGQAIEGVALIMSVYLFFSLVTSALMNIYNKRKALIER